jgi:hypothetical protein
MDEAATSKAGMQIQRIMGPAAAEPSLLSAPGIKTRSGLVLSAAAHARPRTNPHTHSTQTQADTREDTGGSMVGMLQGRTRTYLQRCVDEGEGGKGRLGCWWTESGVRTENCENASEQRLSVRRGAERCGLEVNGWDMSHGTTGTGSHHGDGRMLKDSSDTARFEGAWPHRSDTFDLAGLKVRHCVA